MISNSIQILVQDLENACDPALTAMSKVSICLFVIKTNLNFNFGETVDDIFEWIEYIRKTKSEKNGNLKS